MCPGGYHGSHEARGRSAGGDLPAALSMSVADLQTALGVSEALLKEALWLLTFPGDKRISLPAKDRVALGPEWAERCEGPTCQKKPHR
jgi:hypothetical protein